MKVRCDHPWEVDLARVAQGQLAIHGRGPQPPSHEVFIFEFLGVFEGQLYEGHLLLLYGILVQTAIHWLALMLSNVI